MINIKKRATTFSSAIIAAVFYIVYLFAQIGDISVYSATNPNGQDDFVILGKGCTTAYYIDNDMDGYGVASPIGPDADDNDPTVNTPDTMLAKYGSLTNFLNTAKDYHPLRILSVSTIAEWDALSPTLRPGDLVVFRAGTYTKQWGLEAPSGASGMPIIVMAYPGERAVIDATGYGLNVYQKSLQVFDGFILDSIGEPAGRGGRITYSSDITFRNLESLNHSVGIMAMEDLHNVLIEGNVLHDNPLSHGIYLGSRDFPNSQLVVRGNLMYRNGRHGIQHNGRVMDMLLDGNIIHSNFLGGISLMNGVSHSVVSNNLIFNNNKQGIVFYMDGDAKANQTYNQIVNNTIWIGKYSWNGAFDTSAFSPIVVDDGTAPTQWSMDYNTFRSNILVSYNGASVLFSRMSNVRHAVIENNVLYKRATGDYASPGNLLQSSETDGTHSSQSKPGATYQYYWWNTIAMQQLSPYIRNNVFADPGFKDVSIDYYLDQGRFNFDLLAASPAIGFGLLTDAPATDLRGAARTDPIDAGCYEYSSPTPSPVNPPPPPPPPPATIYGDVSGDGLVNAADVLLLAQHIVGLTTLNSTQTNRGDVSGNGQVTAYDVSLILKKVLGLINTFPVE